MKFDFFCITKYCPIINISTSSLINTMCRNTYVRAFFFKIIFHDPSRAHHNLIIDFDTINNGRARANHHKPPDFATTSHRGVY